MVDLGIDITDVRILERTDLMRDVAKNTFDRMSAERFCPGGGDPPRASRRRNRSRPSPTVRRSEIVMGCQPRQRNHPAARAMPSAAIFASTYGADRVLPVLPVAAIPSVGARRQWDDDGALARTASSLHFRRTPRTARRRSRLRHPFTVAAERGAGADRSAARRAMPGWRTTTVPTGRRLVIGRPASASSARRS